MDNSFIVPWLSYLYFQNNINNKARFLIFFINILNVQVSIMLFVICLILFVFYFFLLLMFFIQGDFLRFQSTRSNNTLGIEFFSKKFLEVYIYTFCFDRVKFDASYLIFKAKNSIIM